MEGSLVLLHQWNWIYPNQMPIIGHHNGLRNKKAQSIQTRGGVNVIDDFYVFILNMACFSFCINDNDQWCTSRLRQKSRTPQTSTCIKSNVTVWRNLPWCGVMVLLQIVNLQWLTCVSGHVCFCFLSSHVWINLKSIKVIKSVRNNCKFSTLHYYYVINLSPFHSKLYN